MLVEEIREPRSHDHEARPALTAGPRLAGRNREHKLVHFDGPASLLGKLVEVTVERSGAYSLSGRLDAEFHDA